MIRVWSCFCVCGFTRAFYFRNIKLHTFCTQVNRINMAQKKNESREPDPFEKEMLIELQNALNQQFSATFHRVQKDYGSVGVKMAKAADAILYDQDFVDFLFGASITRQCTRSCRERSRRRSLSPSLLAGVFHRHL